MTLERWLLLFLVSFGTGCGLTALAVLVRVYARNAATHLDQVVAEHSGVKQFFLGLLNFIPLFLIGVVLCQLEPLRIFGLLVFTGILTLAFLGLVGWARAVGRDVLFRMGVQRFTEIHEILVGNLVLVGCSLIPLFGLIFWTGFGFQCLGTGLLWLFRRYNRLDESDVTEPIRL
ncbi:MAG: hypothetical protein K1Y36_29065 [Blastocatellia bacterium]|nr:hypothetical protein [Blastocatellia bacterium]